MEPQTILELVVAGIAALAAIAAAIAAGFSAAAARTANRTAVELVAIEAERHHAELRPEFHYSAEVDRITGLVDLRLKLVGPASLDRLDGVAVSIRDDSRMRTPQVGGATHDEIAAQIWGPYRFTPSVDQADPTGRHIPTTPLTAGDELKLQLEPTRQPSWSDGEWATMYDGDVIRLALMCTLNMHEPWTVLLEATPVDPLQLY